MSKNLVIVESPAKSKTIKKYLGNDFEILASYGHVRDLEPKEASVDVENHFKMKYQLIDRNKRHVDAIKKAAKTAESIYLATDPDREGEAISWHIYELLKNARLLKDKTVHRIAFNEITKSAVTEAVAHPRELAMELVNAQQARRALDFLVGFKLSPLLWKKVRRGLSAGRVQSPALRMIVERELEIEAFEVKEYWGISAELQKKRKFFAKLTEYNQQKLEQFSLINDAQANDALETIKQAANGSLIVDSIVKKQKRRNPAAPFITSTLQQDAARKLGFTTKKTMMLAQQLYEGIDLGKEGSVGLITYMRTDSTNLSQDAVNEIRMFITESYGSESLPSKPRVYKTKNQNAQEAHEAIRPTSAFRKPDEIKSALTQDQYKLYALIWKRAVACQMIHAVLNTVAIELVTENRAHRFKATGSVIHKPGFLSVYQEAKDEDAEATDEGTILPEVKEGEKITVNDITAKQHFTEPPPRYSEASLVKALEEHGIGRPSTYATIISTLQQREYVEVDKKRFKPTDVGRVVNGFLTNYFKKYVEYSFTANLEDELDNIAEGKLEWVPVLEEFWQPFIKQITDIDANVKKSDVTQEALDEDCPECGHKLSIRLGRTGRFIGCTNYPECKYTRALTKDGEEPQEKKAEPEIVPDRKCPSCESDLLIKQGRYGKFIGCSNYPNCKHMEPLEKPKDTGIQCPKCKKNNFVEKKSRKGKVFYACAGFPKCKNSFWYPPIEEECPKCHSPILLHKTTKKDGEQKVCPNEECDYVLNIESNPS
ncbi:type I DNA topoisomerase [Fangia hongkongensis]|uniref:type I DNA topoisomerase n=1 Tax=Fangia hongkongensis TaxID=270495 RepID=UPI00035D2D64|nr:type I DNA topoisomerase [Fangia hongkongensis]MBK2124911.1 type I DNA topoisomerase [Fangia hongkongensis]